MSARFLAVGICCLALGAIRCGTTSPAATGATGTPQADAGSGGGSGGGGATDGGSDGGGPTDGGGGGVDGGSGGGGGDVDGGGGGAVDGGGGDGGSGGDVDGGGGGAGTDGGTASTECAGLAADPNGSSFAITPPIDSCGLNAMSDATGNIALGSTSEGVAARKWASYDSQGNALGSFESDGPIAPRSAGFFAAVYGPSRPAWFLRAYAPDGSGSKTEFANDNCNAVLGRASAGGVLALTGCGYSGGGTGHVYWFDDAGNQIWVTPDLGAYTMIGTVAGDRDGNTLVTTASDFVTGMAKGNLAGRWVKPDGTLAGDWFVIVSGNAAPATLQSRIEGGVAVMQDGNWVAVLPPLGAPQPPPDWLATRAGQDFRIVRGRRAYAFTSQITAPQPHGSSGGPLVEVVTPSGVSCGTFDTKGYAATVGGDGSVIANTDGCARKVWPGLLGVR